MSRLVQIDFNSFFDRKAVTDAVDRAERSKLSKAGAFVRRTMKSSIRKRRGVSDPGNPPSSHSGEVNRLIFFAYDQSRGEVVIGPLLFRTRIRSAGTGAELLEFGGIARRPGSRRVSFYRARPFARPALEKELPRFPELWKDAVR